MNNSNKEILDLLHQVWDLNPELRFQQLIYILQSGYSKKNKDIGKVDRIDKDGFTKTGYDLFYLQDDLFSEYLKEIIDKKSFRVNE